MYQRQVSPLIGIKIMSTLKSDKKYTHSNKPINMQSLYARHNSKCASDIKIFQQRLIEIYKCRVSSNKQKAPYFKSQKVSYLFL